MGLIKKDGCFVKGVKITPAYAKIKNFNTISDDKISVEFGISQTRELMEKDGPGPLEFIYYEFEYDRSSGNLFNEMYTKAKEDIFKDWEDDIIEEEEDENV